MPGQGKDNQNKQMHIRKKDRQKFQNLAKTYAEQTFIARKTDDKEFAYINDSQTVRDITSNIDTLLTYNKEYGLHLSDEEIEKLKVRQDRNMSQLLLNSSRKVAWWDSPEMKSIKDSVSGLEEALSRQRENWDSPIREQELTALLNHYEAAINYCKAYIDTKTTKTGWDRYITVRNKMESLMREYDEFLNIKARMEWRYGNAKEGGNRGEYWTDVNRMSDLLVESRVRRKRHAADPVKQEHYEENIYAPIEHELPKKEDMPADPAAQLVLKLLTGNQGSLDVEGNDEQTQDNVNIALMLYKALMEFQTGAGNFHFHTAMAGYLGSHSSRKFTNGEGKQQRCNTLFHLAQDADGQLTVSFDGQTVNLGGKEEILNSLRQSVIGQERRLNEMYDSKVGYKLTYQLIRQWKNQDFTLSPEDEDYQVKKDRLHSFDTLAFNILVQHDPTLKETVIENATSEERRKALMYLMEHDRGKKPADLHYHLMTILGAGVDKFTYSGKTFEQALADCGQDEKTLRTVILSYISKTARLKETYFDKKSVEELYETACRISGLQLSLQDLRSQIARENRNGKKIYFIEDEESKTINSKATLRLMKESKRNGKYIRDHVSFNVKIKEDKAKEAENKKASEWTAEQTSVKNFISELLYTHESWEDDFALDKEENDQLKLAKYQRIFSKKEYALAVANIVKNPDLIKTTLSQISFLKNYDEEGKETDFPEDLLVTPLKEAVNALVANQNLDTNQPAEKLAEAIQKALTGEKTEDQKRILTSNIQVADIDIQAFTREVTDGRISNINRILKKQVSDQLTKSGEDKKEKAEPGEDKILKLDNKEKRKAQNKELEKELAEATLTGNSDQAKFIKKVLEKYFEQISEKDQRSVMAYMFREAKPVGKTAKSKELAEQSCLAGMIKGAGPLLQKLLQGLQMEGVPTMLRNAMVDVRSNLLPIPQEIVEAQLADQVKKSGGRIVKIEIEGSLGAASIGQAFLGRIILPRPKDAAPNDPNPSREVVIKVLRPDAENRLKREQQVISGLAGEVSPSMKKSYDGVVERIQQELNLEKEAANIRMGQEHYNGTYFKNTKTNVHSMELCEDAQSNKEIMILEKAPGETVDRYMSGIEAQMLEHYEGLIPFKDGKIDQKELAKRENKLALREGLRDRHFDNLVWITGVIKEMETRQAYLVELAEKWYEQVLYKPIDNQYFFHGDLHSGNIMIDDKGATIIDYGNATTLKTDQRTAMIKLVAAAAAGEGLGDAESGPVIGSMKNLIETLDIPDDQKELILGENGIFAQHKEELMAEAARLFTMGDGQTTMTKISLLFTKAQNLGIPLPPAVANFAQAQLRLQNTLDSYASLLGTMRTVARSNRDLLRSGVVQKPFGIDIDAQTEMALRNADEKTEQQFKKIMRLMTSTQTAELALEDIDEVFAIEEKDDFEQTFLSNFNLEDKTSKVTIAYDAFRQAQEKKESQEQIKKLQVELVQAIKHGDENLLMSGVFDLNLVQKMAVPYDNATNHVLGILGGVPILSEDGRNNRVVDAAEAFEWLKKYFNRDYDSPKVQKLVTSYRKAREKYDNCLKDHAPADLKKAATAELDHVNKQIMCLGVMLYLKRMPGIKGKQTKQPENIEYIKPEEIGFTDAVFEVISDHGMETGDAVGYWWSISHGAAILRNFNLI